MVKYFIALACVSVLIPSSAAAQQRASGTKGAPADRRTQGAAPKTGNSGAPVRPVTRSQDVPKPAEVAPAEQAGNGKIMLQGVPLGQQPVEMSPELQRELDRILQFWSDSSDKIDRLEGQHVRIVYDLIAEVERQAKGEFAYEKPDKGRMDVASVEISDAMLKARQKEAHASLTEKRPSKVRMKKSGEPFDLVKEQQEMWSCDGQRIYSIDMESKEAQVAQLPPDMQGTNIMHSPLPFLFGMKPEEAKRRFSMSFKGDKFDPKTGVAKIVILPRLPQDARNWQKAELILDLKEFLPVAVQLTDPPGTKVTVFQFSDLTKNQPNWIGRLKGENPKTRFAPDLRGLNVHTIPSEADGSRAPEGTPIAENRGKTMLDGDAAKPAVEEAALVNVEGLAHTNAVIELERQGLKRMEGEENQIIFEPGPPARKPEDKFKVMKQNPPAGTPLKPGMKVKLVLFNDPAKAAKK